MKQLRREFLGRLQLLQYNTLGALYNYMATGEIWLTTQLALVQSACVTRAETIAEVSGSD